ncbi:MAG: hypothetical protein Q4Q62_00475 [Thermoplasmata archaeon]|nr:hypothetical protein [Thermoplasmata archaeon]
MSDNPYQRPLLVTILAAIYILVGIISIIGGIACNMVTPQDLIDAGVSKDIADVAGTVGIILAVLGVVYLIVAAGFLKGWSVMWYLGVIISVISIIGCIYMAVTGNWTSAILLIIDLVILWYLFRPNVKLFFLGHE